MTSNKSNKNSKNRFARSGSSETTARAGRPGPTRGAARKGGAPAGRSSKATSAGGSARGRGAPAPKPAPKGDRKTLSARTTPSQGTGSRPRPLVSSKRRGVKPGNAPTVLAPPKRKPRAATPTENSAPPAPDWAPDMVESWNEQSADWATDDHDEAPASSERPGAETLHDSGDYGLLGIGTRVLPPDMEFELFEEDSSPLHTPASPEPDTSVEERIRELEARLDGMMTTVSAPRTDAPAPPESRRDEAPSSEEVSEASAVEAARELLQSDYYRRRWGRASLRAHVEEVDDFGLAPDFEQRVRPLLKFLFRHYFRVETRGIDNIPSTGRAVIVANHSGTLPLDGVMLREALREHHPSSRDLRWLAEDFIFYLPFVGVALNRIGAVRACQENAQRLLATDHLIAVFPEGIKGIKKLYRQRYQLQRFGRGGYIRLCLRTQSPLIPCAIVGAEETNPMLYRLDNVSRLLGLQYLPVTPTFPWLGPLGLLPAPTKWRMTFGEPIALDGYGPEAADDHVLIGRLSERVRASINSMLETSLRTRRSVWL